MQVARSRNHRVPPLDATLRAFVARTKRGRFCGELRRDFAWIDSTFSTASHEGCTKGKGGLKSEARNHDDDTAVNARLLSVLYLESEISITPNPTLCLRWIISQLHQFSCWTWKKINIKFFKCKESNIKRNLQLKSYIKNVLQSTREFYKIIQDNSRPLITEIIKNDQLHTINSYAYIKRIKQWLTIFLH